jgi:nucleoside-diphosphate-sugar epimerase
MNLLLIGGTGNLSEPVLTYLTTAGHILTCLTRGNNLSIERRLTAKYNIKFIHYTDFSSQVFASLSKITPIDYVIDFAAYTPSDIDSRLPVVAKYAQIGYIFISTTAFYDRSLVPPPYSEDIRHISNSWNYAISKYNAEIRLFSSTSISNLKFIILRLGHTIGSGVPVFLGNSGHAYLDCIQNRLPIPVYGNLTHPWSIGTADGLAHALNQLMLNTMVLPDRLILQYSGSITSWHQILEQTAKSLDVPFLTKQVSLERIKHVSKNWLPSINNHKKYADFYNLNALNSYVRPFEEPNLEQIVNNSIQLTYLKPVEKDYDINKKKYQLLVE